MQIKLVKSNSFNSWWTECERFFDQGWTPCAGQPSISHKYFSYALLIQKKEEVTEPTKKGFE